MDRPAPDAGRLQETLFRVLEILGSPDDLRAQLTAVHAELWAVIDASNLYVAVFDPASRLYFFPYIDDIDADYAASALEKSLTDYVRRTGRPLLVTDDVHQRLEAEGEVELVGLPSAVWMGAPLLGAGGTAFGVVAVQSYTHLAYGPTDLDTLVRIARCVAIAVERSVLAERRKAEIEAQLVALRSARDEAVRASDEKSRFLANMSHELRTPLNAILGYAELLLDQLPPDADPEARTDLGAIRNSARHLRELIDGVLDLTQVESGHYVPTYSEFALGALVDGLAEQIAPLVAQGGNRLVRVGDAEVGRLTTDRRALFQVLLNLLGNACKFTKDGTVALRARRRAEGWLDLEVSDTGAGIDPSLLPTLFEPFTQGDASSTRAYGGSGLGLAIARRFVEALGGTIEVRSVVGRGTTFLVRIPVGPAGE